MSVVPSQSFKFNLLKIYARIAISNNYETNYVITIFSNFQN